MMQGDRELWLERRKAALLEVAAIEKAYPTRTVTLTINRDDAKRLGLLELERVETTVN